MQRDSRFFTRKASPSDGFEVGEYTGDPTSDAPFTYGVPGMPSVGGSAARNPHVFPHSSRGVQLQPSETCPKNFVIFDHTDNRRRIMYHPALAHNFSSPSTHGHEDHNQENLSYLKEEAEEINALLSSGGEEEDEDDDVVSTGRTPPNWGGSSPDSSGATSSGLKLGKLKYASVHQSSNPGGSSERKREKTRKMVKALRGIIPGGNRMDTPAVLDEAVRYLKSLKMEAKKLGMPNANN